MTAGSERNIRAMVVGTSDVVANPVKVALRATRDLELAGEAVDGIDAVSRFRRTQFDVIFIDIGDKAVKPATDLTRLLKVDPDAQIVLVATLTFANVKNAMAGLVNGAAEFVLAPSNHTRQIRADDFQRQISNLAQELGRARRKKGAREIAPLPVRHEYAVPKELRPRRSHRPKVIAIASSTGGPQALFRLFSDLPHTVKQPIFLTQHMPAGFTDALAKHIHQRTGWICAEAKNGEKIEGGRVYMAPGDFHMMVETGPSGPVIRTNQAPPENFCRPSAEPMVRTLAEVYGPENMLFVVLTGMGADGRTGAQLVANGGGTVAVQDKDSSVVWGMPGAIAQAGTCHAMLPIGEMGAFMATVADGK